MTSRGCRGWQLCLVFSYESYIVDGILVLLNNTLSFGLVKRDLSLTYHGYFFHSRANACNYSIPWNVPFPS